MPPSFLAHFGVEKKKENPLHRKGGDRKSWLNFNSSACTRFNRRPNARPVEEIERAGNVELVPSLISNSFQTSIKLARSVNKCHVKTEEITKSRRIKRLSKMRERITAN